MRCRTGPRRHPLAVGLGAALVLAWGCDGAPSGDEGDAPAPWALDPAPLVSLGVVDGAPEEVFSRIADVTLLSDGGVAVADVNRDGAPDILLVNSGAIGAAGTSRRIVISLKKVLFSTSTPGTVPNIRANLTALW